MVINHVTNSPPKFEFSYTRIPAPIEVITTSPLRRFTAPLFNMPRSRSSSVSSAASSVASSTASGASASSNGTYVTDPGAEATAESWQVEDDDDNSLLATLYPSFESARTTLANWGYNNRFGIASRRVENAPNRQWKSPHHR